MKEENLSRRAFLTTAGAVGVALASTGLAACTANTAGSPSEESPASGPAAAEGAGTSPGVRSPYTWEVPPAPITDIADTVEADIIVIGGGTAGITTAVSAAEKGAKVVLISKSDDISYRGGANFVINSSLCKQYGIEHDLYEVKQRLMDVYQHLPNEKVWEYFFNRSGEAMDWACDFARKHGMEPIIHNCETDEEYPGYGGYLGTHMFLGGPNGQHTTEHPQADFLWGMIEEGEALGVEFRFSVAAKQLVRGDDNATGRVTAVIAQEKDGSYTKYVGNKAIVLATGDYNANEEMMERFHPNIYNGMQKGQILNAYSPPDHATGDGHIMAMHIGASWQKNDSVAIMLFGSNGLGLGGDTPSPEEWAGKEDLQESLYCMTLYLRELAVNMKGERYANEMHDNSWYGFHLTTQPAMHDVQIIDTKFPEYMSHISGRVGGGKIPTTEELAWYMCYGDGYNSFEEIADAYGLPKETFLASVDRYNELARAGADTDFYKPAKYMHPLENPPYYVHTTLPIFLCALGGLNVNAEMQVMDTDDNPIPGLYAVGIPAGNFYGAALYTLLLQGCNLGRTLTFGYLTGRYIAENE